MTDFDAWVAEARAADIVAAARARGARLKRAGTELVGPCPACGGRDRFAINLHKKIFHCRRSGAGGDAIALVQYLDACDFRAACAALTGRPDPSRSGVPPSSPLDAAAREATLAARAEGRARQAAEAERSENAYRRREIARARGIWDSGVPIAGTPVERYLRGRGLVCPRSFPVRCAADLPYWAAREGRSPDRAGRTEPDVIFRGPAMLAAIVGPDGATIGCHVTWIDDARPGAKATIVHPDTGEIQPAKKVRGSARGGHIPLWRVARPRRLVIGEGIETTLSVWAALLGSSAPLDASRSGFQPSSPPDVSRSGRGPSAPLDASRSGFQPSSPLAAIPADLPEILRASAGWCGVSLGNIGGRAAAAVRHPSLKRPPDRRGRVMPLRVPGPVPVEDERALPIPESVTDILLLGDGDSDRFSTDCTLRRAAARWRAPGRRVRIAWAPEGRDFNDWLRETEGETA